MGLLPVFILGFDDAFEGSLVHEDPQMGLFLLMVTDNLVVVVQQFVLLLIALLGIDGFGALFEDGLEEAALVASAREESR